MACPIDRLVCAAAALALGCADAAPPPAEPDLAHCAERTNWKRPVPLVRVEPQYPPQAARRGLEGWVHVRFTITTAGSIKDAQVVKSSHGVFERPALQAVAKWKYQPQLVGGQPAEAPNRQVRVHFKLEG